MAGYRGIAVGYPEGMNYAFNAENGALSALWKGEYVTANWRSQGPGDFKPVGEVIELAQDVGFLHVITNVPQLDLIEHVPKWPLRPVMTKDEPENPDPLYPKNHGYAFKGYSFGEDGNPTFEYRCGDVMIFDRMQVKEGKLRRTFELVSEKETTVFFRALTGKVTKEAEGVFSTGELRLKTGELKVTLRNFGEEKELLIEMPVSAGKTNYTIDYELLR